MSNKSHLTLVEGNAAVGAAKGNSAFQIVAISELSRPEIIRVEKAVSEVSKKAAILGVAVTPRSWDLRPVVIVADEGTPSVIRFAGPEVTLSLNIHARLKDMIERLIAQSDLQKRARLREWGILEGQLWYRRDMVDAVLADDIAKTAEGPFQDLQALARKIVDAVLAYHNRGVVHGHIVLGNIGQDEGGNVSLLDPGIGIAVLQGLQKLGIEQFPEGYQQQSFAGESFHSEAVLYSSDIYCLGQVLRELFQKHLVQAPENAGSDGPALRKLAQVIQSMTDQNPEYRPSLTQVRDLLEAPQKRTEGSERKVNFITRQGRMLMPGRTERGKTIHPTKPMAPKETKLLPKPDLPPELKKPEPVDELPVVQPEKSLYSVTEDVARQAKTPAVKESVKEPVSEQANEKEREELASAGMGVSWRSKTRGPALSAITIYMLFLALFVFLVAYKLNRGKDNYSQEELDAAWHSNRPSMMLKVADQAVRSRPNETAENLIISSVMKGEDIPLVNGALLRVAFDERWEQDLTAADRRLALALALSSILQGQTPADLEPIENAHPAVILALTSFAGDNVRKILNPLPAALLAKLQPPVGVAFMELTKGEKDLRCGDEASILLAKMATRGTIKSDEVELFLSQSSQSRLRALATLVSQDNERAREVLDILLNHPNLRFEYKTVKWGRAMDLIHWEELEGSEQLLLLAGISPTKALATKNLGKLFSHPDGAIRSFAMKKGLDAIPFEHPGAVEAFRSLADNPEVLSGADTLLLAEFLQQPTQATSARVRVFLESRPAVPLISMLLLATATQQTATQLDFEFSRYLQDQGWNPALPELKRLVYHPERLTRFFAYTKVFSIPDTETARLMLKGAFEKEQVPEFRTQLSEMLEKLQ